MITQRYGDLELHYTTSVRTAWPTSIIPRAEGASSHPRILVGHVGQSGWWPAGFQFSNGTNLADAGSLLLRDVSADRSLIQPCVRWERIGDLPRVVSGPGAGDELSSAVWRPIPPPGYVALSDCASVSAPSLETGVCIRQVHNGRRYARQGEVGEQLFDGAGTRLWSVVTPPYPDGDLDERLFLPVGGFTAVRVAGRPNPTPTTWILDLPAVVQRAPGPGIPVLTSPARPPAQTRVTDRTVTVPYVLVNDPNRTAAWQIQNSPFYRIRRHRIFDLVLFRDNRAGTVAQPESQTITTGVTREAGFSFSVATGITVGASVGVEASAKPFGMGASVTTTASVSASIELGYETRRNVSTMAEERKERGLIIPPRSTGCLWMEQHELVPVRANGETLSAQASLGFRTDYYVTGEFPGGSGVIPFTSDASGERIPLPARHLLPDRPRAAADTLPPDTTAANGEPAEEQ
ncbi:hypothetical protein [Kitasatospora sp. NPDC087315]|uniref:hypothetical protein n=1 Tax=Kitasatospora sp. NPDC087315 TaxID=3364069 RepID=UPI0038043707